MNAVPQRAEQGFLARFERVRDQLPGDRAAREAAADAFRAAGLPTLRNEAWKYTNLRPVAEATFSERIPPLADLGAAVESLPAVAGGKLVFVGGRFRVDLSSAPPGLRMRRFADDPVFGSLAEPERHPLVALNTMLAEDGAVIEVPPGTDGGVLEIVSLAGHGRDEAVAFHPRHRVRLAEGARLVLLETSTGQGAYLNNPVLEVDVAAGASLVHVRLQDEGSEAFHLATVYAAIAANGVYDAFALTLGGRLVRNEFHARLVGPGGAVHLNGAQLLAGRQSRGFH